MVLWFELFAHLLVRARRGYCPCPLAPAGDEAISRAELRMGLHLPPSYRSFLRTSNGFNHLGPHVARLLPVAQVERVEGGVLVSDPSGPRILLNPEVVWADGDWEAWFVGEDGAECYRSFEELVRAVAFEPADPRPITFLEPLQVAV